MPIVSRLASSDGDSNSPRGSPSTSGASSSKATGRSAETGTSSAAHTRGDRRRAASQDATGARKKTVIPHDERIRRKAQSMTAVNGSGRVANDIGAETRTAQAVRGSAGVGNAGSTIRRGAKEAKEKRDASNDDSNERLMPPFSISLKDVVGGLQGMRPMGGSFSRGLLSSSSPTTIGAEGTSSARDTDRIHHGRRVGQSKRLAQPGRLVAMNAGESSRR